MEGKIGVGAAEARDEVVLEGADSSFGGVGSVHAGWDELWLDGVCCHELEKDVGTFIVEAL